MFKSPVSIVEAGCAQELKNAGMRLIVTPEQVDWIPRMKRWTKLEDGASDARGGGGADSP